MRVVGVILAGGSGQRFGGSVPKQFRKLAGKLVIEHTVEIFDKNQDIHELIVVTREDFIDLIWDLSVKNGWKKLHKVLAGGAHRSDSTFSAIEALSSYPADTKILFHGAVRPFVNDSVIKRCVSMLDFYDAVDVVIPSNDTLISVDDYGVIANIPARAQMRRGQTPQAFKLQIIRNAYFALTREMRCSYTCDCSIVYAVLPKTKVATVDGDDVNIKITTEFDLFISEKIMQSRGSELDCQQEGLQLLKDKSIIIFGGSSGIGKAIHDLAVSNQARVYVASRSFNNIDVSDINCVREFLANIAMREKFIDIIINSAGVLIKKPLVNMRESEIKMVVESNYIGAINVAYAAKPYLALSKGMLINFTSSSYTRGRAYYAVYSSTKCAIVNLTQALGEEWLGDGIKVNCINPERTHTPMRTSNFGYEDQSTLLQPEIVATSTLHAALSDLTGMVFDVKK